MNACFHTFRKSAWSCLSAFALATLVTACNVHEWPESVTPTPDPENAPVVLNLNFETELPLFQEITYSRAIDRAAAAAAHDMRYTVEIYSGSRSKASKPLKTLVFTAPYNANPDYSTELTLDNGAYEFYVWADYVDAGTTTDKYYNTSDWEYIVLPNPNSHEGSNDMRDAFRGYVAKTVINSPEVTADNTVDVTMQRPMARFEFIATDVDEFLESESRKRAASNDDSRSEVDLDDYTIVFLYNGFMPSAYNLYTDKPNDAWQGVRFQNKATLTSDGALMGFDYVFVNGSDTSVPIVMGVADKTGTIMSQTRTIDVPLTRSKNTVVKGEFFTQYSQGGVGIEPGFDGSYDIEIH